MEDIRTDSNCDCPEILTGSQLRALERTELARLGEDGLRDHLVDTAILAHSAYSPVEGSHLDALLEDRNFVRYPVRLAFELGTMAPHQIAQPEPEEDGIVLYVHPSLKGQDRSISMAVSYFLPLINYGQIINDHHCQLYGATLHGLPIEQYFAELCQIAESIGLPEVLHKDSPL